MTKYMYIILLSLLMIGCSSPQVKCNHGKIPKIRATGKTNVDPIIPKMNKKTGEVKFTKEQYIALRKHLFSLYGYIDEIEELIFNYNNFAEKYNNNDSDAND